MISAHDMQVVGWPLPASEVEVREWRRSFWAISFKAALSGMSSPENWVTDMIARENRNSSQKGLGQAVGFPNCCASSVDLNAT
jgi:hypothetical protein